MRQLVDSSKYRPSNTVCLTAILFFTATISHAEITLEGTSTLGAQRQAHVAWQGTQTTVQVGETLGEWQVIEIGQQRLVLENAERQRWHIALYARSPSRINADSATAEVTSTANSMNIEANEQDYAVRGEASTAPEVRTVIREYLPVSELAGQAPPSGYRQVNTPFGEYLVKQRRQDKSARAVDIPTDTQAQPANDMTQNPAPIGYRRIKTPFGEITVPNQTAAK